MQQSFPVLHSPFRAGYQSIQPDRYNMGNIQQTYDTDQEYIMCSRLHTPVATNWHAREAQLLASDPGSYISTYQAAKELVYDCGM